MVNDRPIRIEELANGERTWSEKPFVEGEISLARQATLDQLIVEELIRQEAEKRGLAIPEAELDRQVAKIKADYPDRAFEEMMVREYVDYRTWREKLRQTMLVAKVTAAELAIRVREDPQTLAAALDSEYRPPDKGGRLRVRHITMASRPEAEKVRERIKSAADFDRLSKELLGAGPKADPDEPLWVRPDLLPAPLAEVLGSAKPGDITAVVESKYGFSVFQVLEAEVPLHPDARGIMAAARRRHLDRLQALAYDQWVNELKSRAKIVINPAFSAEKKG